MEDNTEPDEIETAAEPTPTDQSDRKAAIVIGPIIVSSMFTLIVGAVMLIAGLLIGYFGRPLVAARLATPTPTAASAPAADDQSTQRAELMNMLVAQTRHFKGGENAPVTILEFSDFQ